ncbi:MAG: diaminopimelate epimerase [Peptococcaceae bacterium]|nr:diaminopimelate epimerase [Peptococcaceae bacterium]
MRFLKVHGLGNDFVLVDAREEKDLPEDPEELRSLAVKVCHRNFGIGADGLVLIRHAGDADVYMQIINSDGSEAEMCGNAIRCAARYIYEKGQAGGSRLRIKTLAGIMVPEIISQNGRVTAVRVDMGEPALERRQIPMLGGPGRVVGEPLHWEDRTFKVTGVSMGNPHCVIFVPDIGEVPLSQWGPGIECHPAFPAKTNVEFVQVLNGGEVAMRVWERGAGPTLACGTGACAAVVACVLNGLTGRRVKVSLAAGHLLVEWDEDSNRVYMTGPAEFVFKGEYPCG